MSQLKLMLINFLTEEDKFISITAKEKSRTFLMNQSDLMIMNMALEKSRNQGEEQAFLFYQDKIEKGKI